MQALDLLAGHVGGGRGHDRITWRSDLLEDLVRRLIFAPGGHIAGGFQPTACPQGEAAFANDADHACQ